MRRNGEVGEGGARRKEVNGRRKEGGGGRREGGAALPTASSPCVACVVRREGEEGEEEEEEEEKEEVSGSFGARELGAPSPTRWCRFSEPDIRGTP